MFQAKATMLMYCVSPVHMGAGTALGAIDNPIQRERHTQHPLMAGSGIKGALRHQAQVSGLPKDWLARVFGPETDASEHAGAISISDAQLVAFPVRSLRRSYVYATCPTAIGRLRRLLSLAGVDACDTWVELGDVKDDEAIIANDGLLSGNPQTMILEAFAFAKAPASKGMIAFSSWLGQNISDPGKYFAEKVRTDTVVLSDSRFGYFVRNSTVVEPHVRIDDETGTASDGGLFYTENVPPEAIFVSMVMASASRRPKEDHKAEAILQEVRDHFAGKMVQVGGDLTTGRGQVVVSFVNGGGQ